MLIHVNDAVTLQGARALRQPLIIPYGIHQEYELQIVTGHDNAPVDVESRGCVKWTLTITPSPENPTTVLAYAVFAENIATGSYIRFDFAATSVEMYKHVAGNPATPAVLQLQGFTADDGSPATVVITLPVALVTTAQQRLPVDLSTALMQELQLAVSVVGAAQREISKYAGDSSDAADRAEQAAMNAHASEVNAEHSATAAGISAGNASDSEQAAAGSASDAADSAAAARASENAAHDSEVAAKASEDAAALSESHAHDSEVAAKASENAAAQSESNAHASELAAASSESNAHDSEVAAKASEQAAAASESNAHDSEVAAKASEQAAATSESNAHDSEVAAKASEQAAAASESNAHDSEVAAKASEQAAASSESNAHDSEVAAKASEQAAASSESNAHDSEVAAKASEQAAATSESNAHDSEVAAKASEQAAAASESNAHDSEVAAAASQADALASKNAAAQSESNALGYKNAASQSAANAHDSEVAAKASEDAAALSAQHAASSESAASGSATAAEQSAISAYNSKNDASASAVAAHDSEVAAAASESQVAHDASEAASSAAAAEQSEQDAAAQARLSESWAKGDTGVRDDEDTNNAKYWAEQARQASHEGKADKVVGAVDGHLAGLDATGNLTDSGIPSDNVALQDGSYDTLHAGTAGNLVDDRAPSTGRKFGFDTACGDVSISDDGTADPTLLKGTTYVKNQLVGDSKVIKDVGQGVVTSPYAVEGDIDHAYIKGRSLVRNQLVPASVEKEGSSSTGVVEISDAVAGDALALKMVAPRSVVVNQGVKNGNFTNGNSNWTTQPEITTTFSDGYCYFTAASAIYQVYQNQTAIANHYYLVASRLKLTTATDKVAVRYRAENIYTEATTDWQIVYGIIMKTTNASAATVGIQDTRTSGWDTVQIDWIQIVDLTQYFNGDQTLIDSITSWDDLVAYDPRFASYVEYNTGEVSGVTPTVKVSGKNLWSTENTIVVNKQTDTLPVQLRKGTYTLSALVTSNDTDSVYSSISFVYEDGTYDLRPLTRNTRASLTWTFTRDVVGVRLYASNTSAHSQDDTATWSDIQIELGSTATSYEPYHDGGTATSPVPLYGVGTASDSYDAVTGKVGHKMGSVDLGTLNWVTTWWEASGRIYAEIVDKALGTRNVISAYGVTVGSDNNLVGKIGICGSNNYNLVYVGDANTHESAQAFISALSGVLCYYELATPTTYVSTPTQISLQAGINNAIQTDGGRTLSSLDLGYDGTSFDVPLTSGRTYITKINNTTEVVTDGTAQHVTGGVDMIVDLTMLYNGVSSLITPITTWNALVADTGMYGSYTSYDEGTVVHSDQTALLVNGKNLIDQSVWQDTHTRGGSMRKGYNWVPVIEGQTIHVKFTPTGSVVPYIYMMLEDFEGNYLPSSQWSSYTNSASNYITTSGLAQNDFSITFRITGRFTIYLAAGSSSHADVNAYLKDLQVEYGDTATTYEPYYNGGTATAGVLKGIPGSVYDQLEAVTGKITTRIGSYTFTGNENWTASPSWPNIFYIGNLITNAYRTSSTATVFPYMLAGYRATYVNANAADMTFDVNNNGHTTANQLYIKDTSCTTAAEIAAKLAGKTVYYRLATYTSSTTTAQPLTQSTGNLTVLQTAGTLPVNLDIRHAVSEWDEPIVRNCKYIFRDNGEDSLVTGSTTVTYKHVVGGEHKLINLTQWFGRNREPSIADFYKLFPTWKDADIPYDRGTVLNYKGTGVRTIGFNAYNHATGTAVLLGGNKYQICGTYTSCSYTDQWGNAEELSIDDKGIFIPVNNGTLTVVGGNDTDTCVHLCWSGYKNYGEPDYEWLPYEEKGVEWDLSQWFPNGMNGIGDVQDEITNNSATAKIAVVDASTLTWDIGTVSWGNYFYAYLSNVKTYDEINCTKYPYAGATSVTALNDNTCTAAGGNGTAIYIRDDDAAELYATGAEFAASLTGVYVVYKLATPVTSDVAPTQNFSYPVNDFGTEQSLPVNTLTLLTTDLDADIRYSLDFTRTVANYSKIEDDVKQLVEEKDNLARQDGNYGDKGGVFNYATQLLDPNAPPTEASYGNRTAAGDVSIADNGTADVTSLQGTTQIQNQLVHDTNTNTKSSVDGRLVLTDAVGGQLSRLEIHGGCVVHNQLVKESVEKTATGTGRLGVEDGVAGNAKSLVMTAPRSVVMNQLCNSQPANLSNWSATSSITVDLTDGVFTLTSTTDATTTRYCRFNPAEDRFVYGHKYALYAEILNVNATYCKFSWRNKSSNAELVGTTNIPTPSENWQVATGVGIAQTSGVASASGYLNIQLSNTAATGTVAKFRNMMCVDLTQYFNGSTALINSINTWDDLVAYDSSFASYVPYNTGTVQGVQPTVKVNHTTDVACPVELFGPTAPDTTNNKTDTFDAVTGIYTTRFKTLDMGDLAWTYGNNGGMWANPVFVAKMPDDYYQNHYITYQNSICPILVQNPDIISVADTPDGYRFSDNQYVYIKWSKYTTAADFKTAVTGKIIVYCTTEPTTFTYTPTTVPTVDIYNTALQTAGTRQCSLALTYDGKDQTIALNPSHTYVFNDNQEDDSVITGQSSIEAVGGEDQLVDITQLYNGDATKIANIHSWVSLSTRFHRYRDLLPYNPGTVEPYCPTVRVFPNEHAYGILYDPSQNTPACQWVELNNGVLSEVASFDSFKSHPCHELYRCVMSDLANRTIAYYLDDEDSDKKYNGTRNGITSDGTASVLTGADGDVETEMPIGYWDLDEDYQGTGKVLWLISDQPFMGSWYPAEIHDFFYVSPDGSTPRKQYVGSYRGCICDADGNPLNTTEGALAQVTGTSSTNKVRSIKGALPYVSVSLNDFTVKSGRNGGSSVNVKYHQWLFLLMAIEYGTLDNQKISYGYAGGIQNAFCFWRKSGRVNAGNGTAEIKAVEGTQDMDNFQRFTIGSTQVQRDTLLDADGRYAWSVYNRTASSTRYYTNSPTPSNGDVVYTASTGTTTAGTVASYTIQSNRTIQFQYRGIENPFGEVWEFEHGIQKFQTGSLKSFRGTDNVTYTRSPVNDGASSRAWTDPPDNVFWTTTGSLTTSSFLYSDPSLTTATTVKYKDQPVYRYSSEGYWETLATGDYTMTDQNTSNSPVYTVRHNHWPLSGWDTKFDPVTFFMRKTGSPGASGRYLPDYWNNDGSTGSRVTYVGGYASGGSSDGLGRRYLNYGLAVAAVYISGRPSA